MLVTRALVVSLASTALACSATAPEPAPHVGPVECPAGSRRDHDRCVATEVTCPDGSRWEGAHCVATVVVAEPEAPAALAPRYVGQIQINGNATDVETRFVTGGAVAGRYVYGPRRTEGELSECRLAGRRLSCTWIETGLRGTFAVELAPDGRAFAGNWDFEDGRPGGGWNGRSEPPAAVAVAPDADRDAPGKTPPGDPPPAGLTGTFRGSIGIGGKAGPVVTELDTSTGRVTGSYRYGNAQGRLSDCRLAARQLACTWTEGALTGGFRVELAKDLKSFRGTWDFADGRPGGAWSGSR